MSSSYEEDEAKRLESALQNCGISADNFSTMGKKYITVLSKLAETLNLDNFDLSSYVDSMQNVVDEHEQVLEKQRDMDDITQLIREKTRQALVEKEEMNVLVQQFKTAAIEREKQGKNSICRFDG